MRTEARLTYTGPQGDVSTGLAGSWAAGAVLVTDDGPARFERIARNFLAPLSARLAMPRRRQPGKASPRRSRKLELALRRADRRATPRRAARRPRGVRHTAPGGNGCATERSGRPSVTVPPGAGANIEIVKDHRTRCRHVHDHVL